MAIRTKAQYSGLYLTSGGTWPDQASGAISPQDLRDGVRDLYDSINANWSSDASGIAMELSGLYNVADTPPISGSLLVYAQSSGVWTPSQSVIVTDSGLVVSKASSTGIKVDLTTPTFGWKDLVGQIVPRPLGGPAPTLAAYRGTGIQLYSFAANDVIDNIVFHMPHDYVPGTDMYIHTHWGHNGTSISGNFVIDYFLQYSKGYNQAGQVFNSTVNLTHTISGITSVTTHPQYGHFIDEIQFTTPSGDATHLDTNLMEVDGLLIVGFRTTTIPTIGGGVARPFIFMIDIHYQTNGITGTKDKNYPFYT